MIIDEQGYKDAVNAVMAMSLAELVVYLDGLYGRAELPRSATPDAIRQEALAQTERAFGPDYERRQLNQKMAFRAALMPNRKEPDDLS